MTILRIEVCEVCHVIGKATRKYRIGDDVRLTRMPLCDDDSADIRRLLDLRRPLRRSPNKPVTMKEVQARKTGTRKPPPRVTTTS